MPEYTPRLIDKELEADLRAFGAVSIVGPKWCGKTTTASQIAKSILRLQDPDTKDGYLALAELKPSELLIGDNPRLIDEWQIAPQLWDSIRLSVDLRGEPGLYILTGSTTVNTDKICHSGAGRIDKLKMGTMSLFESGDSTGSISLNELFGGKTNIRGISGVELEELAGLIVRGGWPQSVGKTEQIHQRLIKGYCERIIDTEVISIDGKKRNPYKMRGILRSLSRRISSPMSKKGIVADMSSKEDSGISINTLNDYLDALRNIYVLEDMRAWNPNLRSKSAIRTADTVHLCDPAIAAYFLAASKEDLMKDPSTFGLLFESLVVRDLRTYSQCIDGDVFHYRDESGLEIDAIIHLHNGKWAAIEAKLGDNWVDEGAANLLKLKNNVNTENMGEPAFLAVVTGSTYAYTRKDGVHVIPVTCLRD
jgi:predicted AAA+ superfamily ATPase